MDRRDMRALEHDAVFAAVLRLYNAVYAPITMVHAQHIAFLAWYLLMDLLMGIGQGIEDPTEFRRDRQYLHRLGFHVEPEGEGAVLTAMPPRRGESTADPEMVVYLWDTVKDIPPEGLPAAVAQRAVSMVKDGAL